MQHITNFQLDRIDMGPSPKAVVKAGTGPFASYRPRMNPHPPRLDADDDGGRPYRRQVMDLRWQAGWAGSAKEMLRFTENLVFADTLDLCLKSAI